MNQNILVLHGNKLPCQPKVNETEKQYLSRMLKVCWVARILEIRARVQNNQREDAYFVVVWYDNKGNTSLKYHGTRELDIIRGSTIAAPIDIHFVASGKSPKTKELLYYQKTYPTQGSSGSIDPKEDCWLAPPKISTRV